MDPKGPRPTSDKLRLNLHGTSFGGKINWFRPQEKQRAQKGAQKGAHDLKNKKDAT